uniref:Protein kinase domain-containing protein n=1 Tax=Panagrolaimus sp. ES5 TaxID=591445 RepID=A0AC34FG15_9BILA
MDVTFSAFLNETAVNFVAVIYKNEANFDFVLNFTKEKLLSETSLCRFGNFIGAFQIGSNDKKTQKIVTMALPLYFNDNDTEWYFEYNFKKIYDEATIEDYYNQTCFENYLANAQNGPDLNQTIIFYIDSLPPCIKLNTFWDKTNHRLEVIVHGFLSDTSYNQTLSLIAPRQYRKSNHWNRFDPDDNFEDFINFNTKSHQREEDHQEVQLKLEASPLEPILSSEERQKAYIDKKFIQIDQNKILGKGANAIVYRANFKNKYASNVHKNDATSKVALKILTKFVSADDVEEFVRELDALLLIGPHSNIITFYGWTLQEKIPALITELAETDLLHYVRKLRGLEFPLKQILSILWQITVALEHIASLSMVHRDVACRNILLTESGIAKLADFGLCCHCDESFTYRASLQKRLPLKWLSIEALVDRLFSEKSDVWSFGVLCFETFSDGSVPYPALSNVEMLEVLQNGKRLEKPIKASNEIYDLMLKCWKEQPAERPTFKELSHEFKNILENETCNYGYLTLDFAKINE